VEGEPRAPGRRRIPALELLLVVMALAVFARPYLARFLDGPVVQTWSTLFVSIALQALPFLVLGVAVSGAIAALVPSTRLAHLFPKRAILSVPLASAAGGFLPGCECGSVPISARLIDRGAPAPAALAFMLSAPAINPVVLVSTAVAFPGRPMVVVARFAASLLTAIVVGLVWTRVKRETKARGRHVGGDDAGRWTIFRETVGHDFLHAGGFLVVGAAAAATLQVVVPREILGSLAGSTLVAVPVMALLAVVLSICSEADAFVAASLGQFPMTARLAFLVVGPAVDLKLIALQAGTFGRSFALRFAPLTLVVAVAVSVVVGMVLL
jgi:uncharacterized membrane protein YraQ (UPF0718 family)